MRIDRALQYVDDRSARSDDRLPACDGESHFSGNHNEKSVGIGMQAARKLRAWRCRVVRRVLLGIFDDLLAPIALAGILRFQLRQLPERAHWRLINAAFRFVDPPGLSAILGRKRSEERRVGKESRAPV